MKHRGILCIGIRHFRERVGCKVKKRLSADGIRTCINQSLCHALNFLPVFVLLPHAPAIVHEVCPKIQLKQFYGVASFPARDATYELRCSDMLMELDMV